MRQRARQSSGIYTLLPQATSFIGRVDEIIAIVELLADPACRLLTLVGPGGIGKTRLAIRTAGEVRDSFSDGVFFISLQPIQSIEFLISAIGDAIDLPLSGQADPQIHLVNYLRKKEMLLVLDNFEQLLPSPGEEAKTATDLLSDILKQALEVKLLVTSREVLNLQEEWLYPVLGLPFPEPATVLSLESKAERQEMAGYDAVQLFAERARRVRPDFSIDAELADVVRICRLVEGLPLALELAASWTKTLSCADIATEIRRSLDFLATPLRNFPDRQRSMRAVFDQSWKLLTPEERKVFKRLSVFRGGFGRGAAERVAKASLPILLALADKSLVRAEPDGRYQIHELLRQCAAEQLVQSPDDVAQIYDRHSAYYADFLFARLADMDGERQPEATLEINAELENIRAAWQWAVELGNVEEIQKSIQTLDSFFQFQSRYLEGLNAFEQASQKLEQLEQTPEVTLTLAQLLVFQAWLNIRLGRFEEAKQVSERSRSLYAARKASPPPSGLGTSPLLPLAIVAVIRGDYSEAVALGEQARQAGQAQGDRANLCFSYYVLTGAFLAQGEYQTARRYAQQAYEMAKAVNNRWFLAYCLNEWGNVARAMADYAEARQHYQASYAIRYEFNDPEGMAVALSHLGKVAMLEENYAEAGQYYQQSFAIYQDLYDRGGLATSLNGLGTVTCALGDYQAARQYFHRALEIAVDIQFVPLILSILIGIGELLLQTDQPEQGLKLLAFTCHHPASDRETKDRAGKCLARYQTGLPSDLFKLATQRGQAANFETVVATVQLELSTSLEAELPEGPAAEKTHLPGAGLTDNTSPLVEPLTSRELEVLQLISSGLTNRQIADELIISVGTAKWYTGQIYSKLNVSNRTQAVAQARELKILA